MSNEQKPLSERVRLIMFAFPHDEIRRNRVSELADEIATLAQRLAEAERILRDTLDAIPGEAIGKKQIVAFLENVHDNVQLWEDER